MIVYPGAKVEIHGDPNLAATTAMRACQVGHFQQFLTSFGNGAVAIIIMEGGSVQAIPVERLRFIEPDIYHSDYSGLEKRVHDRMTLPRVKPNCMYCGGHHALGIACPEMKVTGELYKCTDTDKLKCLVCGEIYNGIHECKG